MDSTSPRASATRRTEASDKLKVAPSATAATSRQESGSSRMIPLAMRSISGSAARCGAPFVETGSIAFQRDTHVAGAADGTRFAQHDPDPCNAELLEDQHGDVFRQRFHQVKLRRLDETQNVLRHALVIQGVFDRIAQGRLADVGADLDIDDHGLFDLPLPIEDPDDGFGLERANENLIHRNLSIPWFALGAPAPRPSGRRVRGVQLGFLPS